MKRKIQRRVSAVLLVFAMLVSVLQGIPGLEFDWAQKAEAAELGTRMNQFISDSRWRNGVSWGWSQRPKLSSWDSKGCCAYAADFVKYVYGSDTLRGAAYYNIAEVRAGDVIYVDGGEGEHWFVVLGRRGCREIGSPKQRQV